MNIFYIFNCRNNWRPFDDADFMSARATTSPLQIPDIRLQAYPMLLERLVSLLFFEGHIGRVRTHFVQCTLCVAQAYRLHHCFSQGMPSLLPSIFTPEQFLRKKYASSQDVIWEQYVRPSHLYWASDGAGAGSGAVTVVGGGGRGDADGVATSAAFSALLCVWYFVYPYQPSAAMMNRKMRRCIVNCDSSEV